MMKAIRGWQGRVGGLETFFMGVKSGEMAGRCMMAGNEKILVRNTKVCSQLWERECFDTHQRVQSGLSHVSALIGDQPAHRERVLDYFIDWYRLGLRTNQDWVTGEVESSVERQSSFERMTRFIDMVQAGGTRLWIIPLSQPEYWELNSGLLELIEKKGVGLMDARSIPGMTADDF